MEKKVRVKGLDKKVIVRGFRQTESEKVGQKSERVGQAVIVKVIATCQSLPSVSKQCS